MELRELEDSVKSIGQQHGNSRDGHHAGSDSRRMVKDLLGKVTALEGRVAARMRPNPNLNRDWHW